MKNEPLVSITIPTYNSEKFLKLCLESIKKQTYKNIEIIIIDGHSKDETLQIAKDFGVSKIYRYNFALLGARSLGFKYSNGNYILLLDSDQILDRSTIERAVEEMENNDALVLEETVYRCNSFIEYLFSLDRKLINKIKDFDPYTGVMLPRFYKKEVLKKAFENIPEELLKQIGGQDHAIIYFEVCKFTKKIGYLTNSVKHIEPSNIFTVWKKFYRWGYTSVGAHYGKYDELLKKKERFRKGLFQQGNILESLGSILLLIFKGIPYKLGYLVAKFKI